MDGVRDLREDLFLGFLAGAVAAFLGALMWLGISIATGLHAGYVAPLGVGALVGLAIRIAGSGRGMIFGILGVIFTLIGCLGGEVLTALQLSTTPQHDFYNMLTTVDLAQLVVTIYRHIEPIVYLIYAIGVYEGYKLSMRK